MRGLFHEYLREFIRRGERVTSVAMFGVLFAGAFIQLPNASF